MEILIIIVQIFREMESTYYHDVLYIYQLIRFFIIYILIYYQNLNGKNTFEENISKVILNGNEVENHIKLDKNRNTY